MSFSTCACVLWQNEQEGVLVRFSSSFGIWNLPSGKVRRDSLSVDYNLIDKKYAQRLYKRTEKIRSECASN